jgi:hypothetical protein
MLCIFVYQWISPKSMIGTIQELFIELFPFILQNAMNTDDHKCGELRQVEIIIFYNKLVTIPTLRIRD